MNSILRSIRRIFIVVALLLVIVVPMSAHPSASARPDVGLGAASASSRLAYQSASEALTNQIIIKYKATADISGVKAPAHPDRISTLSAAAGIQLEYFREMSGEAHVLRLPSKLAVSQVSLIAEKLMALGDVEYAEPDRILRHTLTPDDPQYTNQWHYYDTWGINAPGAWDITTGSTNVVVAVIDTGITNHADLSRRTLPGYDFISDAFVANDGNGRDSDPSDPGDWYNVGECSNDPYGSSSSSWHGTHVAGTIGAATNNNVGVAGINWVSKIVPVRVLGKCGGYNSDIIDGMRWAAGLPVLGVPANPNPAKVLNMSLGGEGPCDTAQQNAITDITNHGTNVIVAAGNSHADASGYNPASCNGVIAVAATNRSGNLAYYSNYGSVVDISAPGGETNFVGTNGVLSTLNTGTTVPAGDTYAYYQGTSMATPHVVGVASLVLSMAPTLSPLQVRQILQNTARAFPGGTCNTSCGSGIVDAAAAVGAAPRITSFSPTSVTVGSGAFTLIVNGANLASDSVVKWNGLSRTTSFVSSAQLTATIPASDVTAGGTFSITVTGTHPTYGSITTAARPFVVIGPDVSIHKDVIGSDLKPGDRITFTLSISNVGGIAATGVVVTDVIPSQVLSPTYASTLLITPTSVYSYVWDVGTLGVGQGGVITIYGQIDPGLSGSVSFKNNASISATQDNLSSNNTSNVLVGGSKIYLPLVMKSYSTAPTGWTTIVSEDFEGDFPGVWEVLDNDGTSHGEYYWAKRNCKPYAGGYSGWSVGGGSNGGGLGCGSNYPDNADSWMVYGPFSLADATAGDLSFKLWLNSESNYDGLCRMASTDGGNFYGSCTTGNTSGWIDRVLDLANVPSLGNLMGQSNVWVALAFSSDNITNKPEGAYVDNIVLRKYVSSMALTANAPSSDAGDQQTQEIPAIRTLQEGRP